LGCTWFYGREPSAIADGYLVVGTVMTVKSTHSAKVQPQLQSTPSGVIPQGNSIIINGVITTNPQEPKTLIEQHVFHMEYLPSQKKAWPHGWSTYTCNSQNQQMLQVSQFL
jgi:hypothetical protein